MFNAFAIVAVVVNNTYCDGRNEVVIWCTVCVDSRLNVNVALNRPAYQVSMLGTHEARLANDGNHNTILGDGSCSHTREATNAWWAVDLLVALHVTGVKFTNRKAAGTFVVVITTGCSLEQV